MDGRAKGRSKEAGLIFSTVTLVKIGLVLAALVAVVYGVHRYNDSLREDGREQVRAEWTEATLEQTKAFNAERARMERERVIMSKQYNAEREVRESTQRQLDKEREDAIRGSAVAGNQCFDERMRDQWNRDSGVAGARPPR